MTDEYDRIRIRDLQNDVARLAAENARLRAAQVPRPVPEGECPTRSGWWMGRWKSTDDFHPVEVVMHHGTLCAASDVGVMHPLSSVEWSEPLDAMVADCRRLRALNRELRDASVARTDDIVRLANELEAKSLAHDDLAARIEALEAENARLQEQGNRAGFDRDVARKMVALADAAARHKCHQAQVTGVEMRRSYESIFGVDDAIRVLHILSPGGQSFGSRETEQGAVRCTHAGYAADSAPAVAAATSTLVAERDALAEQVKRQAAALRLARTSIAEWSTDCEDPDAIEATHAELAAIDAALVGPRAEREQADAQMRPTPNARDPIAQLFQLVSDAGLKMTLYGNPVESADALRTAATSRAIDRILDATVSSPSDKVRAEVLRFDQPWSVPMIVDRLVHCADALLDMHSSDRLGWETAHHARAAGIEWLTALRWERSQFVGCCEPAVPTRDPQRDALWPLPDEDLEWISDGERWLVSSKSSGLIIPFVQETHARWPGLLDVVRDRNNATWVCQHRDNLSAVEWKDGRAHVGKVELEMHEGDHGSVGVTVDAGHDHVQRIAHRDVAEAQRLAVALARAMSRGAS